MVENKANVGVEENPPLVYVMTVSSETERNPPPFAPQRPQEEWTCLQCTLLNPARKLYCIACFNRHPDLTPVNVGSSEDYDDDDDDDLEEYPPFLNTDDRQMADQDMFTRTMNDSFVSSQNVPEAQAEEDPFHKKMRRRMRRKRRMMAGGAAGVVAGAVIGGPGIVVAAMVGGAVGTRIVSKHREHLKDKRLVMERYMMETKAHNTPSAQR
jgi:hypothetical protein